VVVVVVAVVGLVPTMLVATAVRAVAVMLTHLEVRGFLGKETTVVLETVLPTQVRAVEGKVRQGQ
jgi:hypothetical protein